MAKKRLSIPDRVECILHAAVFGDESALTKYKIGARTLRNYRREASDPNSELARIYSDYARVLAPEEIKPGEFATWLKKESMRVSQLFMEMISKTKEGDVSAAKAVTSHLEVLGQQTGVMQYVANVSSEWQQDSASRGTSQADRFSSNWNA